MTASLLNSATGVSVNVPWCSWIKKPKQKTQETTRKSFDKQMRIYSSNKMLSSFNCDLRGTLWNNNLYEFQVFAHKLSTPYVSTVCKTFFVQPRLTSHNSFSRIKIINVEWVTLQWGRWRIFYMVVFQSSEKDNYMLIFPGELLLGGEKLSKTGIQKSNFHMSGENFCPFNYNSCHILIMWITV